jgi:hypothetical protein
MAKEKRTKLQPWQKEITKEEFVKEVTDGNPKNVGHSANLNKYYKTDFTNPAYLKSRADKVQRKKDRLNARLDRAKTIAGKKAAYQAVKEFKNSDKYKAAIAAAEVRGAKLAKPKVSKQEKVSRKIAKAKEMLKNAEAEAAKLNK